MRHGGRPSSPTAPNDNDKRMGNPTNVKCCAWQMEYPEPPLNQLLLNTIHGHLRHSVAAFSQAPPAR